MAHLFDPFQYGTVTNHTMNQSHDKQNPTDRTKTAGAIYFNA